MEPERVEAYVVGDGFDQPRPRFGVSSTEIKHLAISVGMLTYAFTAMMSSQSFPFNLVPHPVALLASLLAVSSGFVLHELAHKVIAQRYGLWAEFRAQFAGLGISIAVAALAKILFAAPGAVYIRGRVTLRQNGLISIAGPATNLVIAIASWPLAVSVNPTMMSKVFHVVALINAILAIFNMIPFGPFDGRKIWWWNRPAYLATVLVCLIVLVGILIGPGPLPTFD